MESKEVIAGETFYHTIHWRYRIHVYVLVLEKVTFESRTIYSLNVQFPKQH